MQVSTNAAVIDPDTNEITFINTTTNASSSTSYGVEFDIQAMPTDRLSLGGGVGYLNAEFDSFPDAVVQGQVTDLSGFDIPQAPEWTFSADGQYTFPIFQAWEGFGRVEWSYRDDSIPSINSILEQGFPHVAESFQVWNFRLGAENANYRVEAFVQNAFDEQYFTKNNGFGFAGIQVTPQERYFGVRFLARTN
jgi:iron complex outermembrane receptor protein